MNWPRVVDITIPIRSDMLLYPGDSAPAIRRLAAISQGSPLTFSEITMGCHIGTHVDAPAHFVADGQTTQQLALKHFCGPAVIVEFGDRDRISLDDVSAAAIPRGHHVLLKTRNSELLASAHFTPDYCYLTPDAAEYLLQLEPLSIGFDYYSLDPPSPPNAYPAHQAIARAGLPVFVCLDLKNAGNIGVCQFAALPLPFEGLEGLPVRAVLFTLQP